MPSELFADLLEAGFEVGPRDLGENITTAGLNLEGCRPVPTSSLHRRKSRS